MLRRRHCWPFSISGSLCERSLNERGRRFVRPTGLFLLGEFLSAAALCARAPEGRASPAQRTHAHSNAPSGRTEGERKRESRTRMENGVGVRWVGGRARNGEIETEGARK